MEIGQFTGDKSTVGIRLNWNVSATMGRPRGGIVRDEKGNGVRMSKLACRTPRERREDVYRERKRERAEERRGGKERRGSGEELLCACVNVYDDEALPQSKGQVRPEDSIRQLKCKLGITD